jgi:hypothetical protein
MYIDELRLKAAYRDYRDARKGHWHEIALTGPECGEQLRAYSSTRILEVAKLGKGSQRLRMDLFTEE